MDTKWKKGRQAAAFLCLFLGLNVLLLQLPQLCSLNMNAVTDALQSDYQNTKTFRDAVLNTLYDMVYRTVYAEEIEKEAREDAEWQELWQSGSQTFPDWYSESWDPEHYRYVQGRPNPYQDTANLLYNVTYRGRVLHQSESVPFSVKNGAPKVSSDYNFLLHFDGEALTAEKDGSPFALYGFTEDGVQNAQVLLGGLPQDRVRECRVWLAVRAAPLPLDGSDLVCSVQYTLAAERNQLLLLCGLLGLGLLLCLSSLFCRKSRKLFWQKAAAVTGHLWFEWKLLILALLFYFGFYCGTYPILIAAFWALIFFCNDLRHNRKIWRHSGISRLWGLVLRQRSLLPFQKQLLLCGPAAAGTGFLLTLAAAAIILVYCAWEAIPVAAILLLLLWGAFWWKFCRQYRRTVEEAGKLVEHLHALRAGKNPPPLQFGAASDLAGAAADLNAVQEGVRTAVEEQIKSERMKVELIANVSHDLKTPLTSIVSYIELLQQEEGLPDPVRDYIQILAQKAERLRSIVQDVFDVSKAASGNLPLRPETLDLAKLTRQALAEQQEEIANSGLLFRVSLSEEPTYIFADGERLSRVFQNLIGNALRYSLEGTRVYVTQETDSARTTVTIKNISRDELPEGVDLTERFTRGDASRTDGGSGLGLAIAKSFTEACGGTLRVKGDGDLFTASVSFPLFRDVSTPPSAPGRTETNMKDEPHPTN